MTTSTEAPTDRVTTMSVADIRIREGFNVRHNGGGIDELAASIELLGMLVPLIVDGDGILVAGHRRLAAAQKIGLAQVPVHVSDVLGVQGARGVLGAAAAENIVRQQLSPAEEADAIQRMLEAGYTADGAAQALGMPLARVTRRQKLLAIPSELRALWGPGGDASTSSVPNVAALVAAAPKLAPAILKFHQAAVAPAKNESRGQRALHIGWLSQDPVRYLTELDRAMHGDSWSKIKGIPNVEDFTAVHQDDSISSRDRLGGHPAVAKLQTLEKRLSDAWVYGTRMEIREHDVDAAAAAGAAVELASPDGAKRVIVSRSWLGAHVKDVMLGQFEKRAEAAIKKSDKQRGRTARGAATSDPAKLTAAEQRELDAARAQRDAEKKWASLARGANLDLGRALLNNLAVVELTADVARFFAETSLGWRSGTGSYTPYDQRMVAGRLAAGGLRYVFPDWQAEVKTPTKTDPDKVKIEYLEIGEAEKRLWKWFDAATEPGEILGRALLIHAAALWANERVLPQSRRAMTFGRTVVPPAAEKLLEKVTKPHVPPAVTQLLAEIEAFDPKKAPAA